MFLHEFMGVHREEILANCQLELSKQEHGPETLEYLRDFYDEMLRAIRRDSGIPDSHSPLPHGSDSAARLGVEHQRAGLAAARVPLIFGAISQAVAKIGERYELSIAADEYALLNRCMDAGIATSLENYCQKDRSHSSERTTEVYGHLAHELRNALGNANTALKLMREGNSGVQGRSADVLSRNLLRMGTLIAHCLTSAQADAGIAPLLLPTHVATVLRDVEASALPDRDIHVVLEVDEVLYVAADEMLLTSAVSNLVHNAIKFSREHSVVRVSAHAEDEMVSIRVDDECGGTGGATLEELCEPYVSQRAGSERGFGLGLSITKAAVVRMNGDLQLVDRPGAGCTFVMGLPLLKPS